MATKRRKRIGENDPNAIPDPNKIAGTEDTGEDFEEYEEDDEAGDGDEKSEGEEKEKNLPPVVEDQVKNMQAPLTEDFQQAQKQKEPVAKKSEIKVGPHEVLARSTSNPNQKRVFTKMTWDAMGKNKNGWELDIPIPPEVLELRKQGK